MSLLDKIKKNSTIKETAVLSESKFFTKKDMIPTPIPAINIALSGRLDGGLTPGLTMWAGPSKHFKTAFSLLMAKSYMDKYDDAVLLFYDSEFGTPQSYFDSFGIDTNRVVHTPITDIEQLKFDIMQQLDGKEGIQRGDHIIIIIDSIGNLASKKEVEDALEGKSVADMSRAKQIKSLFRMVTPHLTIKDIPMIVVNHTYKTMELYAKDVVGGGCLLAGTKIILADGTTKNIEDILPDDMVKTLEGAKPVTAVWNPETLDEGTPECFEIEFEDGYKVVCSDKHKFLIDGSWVEAKDLKLGDDVSVV
jgi:RecA/RadA recombinase